MQQRLKTILVDILGFTLILASLLLGWLPGPGGIPLLIIGLSLLANNHEWAERILHKVKVEGVRVFDKLFDGGPKTRLLVDVVTILVIAGAVVLINLATRSVIKTAGISLIIAATFMFFSNRRRYHRIWRRVRQPKHKR